ncbi:MAG: glycosyltransferase [bacterium]|nr:glycosyltransferase [bacterium]
MRFSVIIPVYKREDKSRNCLQALITQDFPHSDFEIWVIEDGSQTKIKEMVEGMRKDFPNFHYLWQENKGPATARNLGIKQSLGEILAFTDNDCVPPKDWLSRLDDGFKRHPEVAGVGGFQEPPEEVIKNNLLARYESYLTRQVYGAASPSEIIGGFEVPTGVTNNVAFWRKTFDQLGLFDESFTGRISGEDPDFKKRVCDSGGRLLFVPVKVVHNRDYAWKSFFKQSVERGFGVRHSQIKYGERYSDAAVISQMILLPLSFVKDLLRLPSPALAGVRFMERWLVGWGQVRYASYIKNAR